MGVLVLCDLGQVTCLLYDAVSSFVGSFKLKKKRKCGFILLHFSLILLLTWKRQLKLPNQILSCYRSLPLAIYSFKEKKKITF